MRVIQPLLVANCLLFVAACSKPPSTEAPSSKPAAVLPPTAPVAVTRPVVTETPVPKGPPILTLRASGAILDPDGKAFGSRDVAEKFLKEEQARTKAASLPFRAERDTDAITVRQTLLLYQRAGFDGVELRETDADDKKGPVVSLLAATTQIDVIVNVNGTGSQAKQVREIILKTPAGETGLGRSEWREQLPKAIKGLLEGKELISKDACSIQADNRLCYEGLLEVVTLCAKAGVKKIVVSAFAKKPGDDAEDGAVELTLPASGAAKRPATRS